MRKAAFGMMLTLLVLSAPFFVFDVKQVNADSPIYIRTDGSIEGTDRIISLDNTTYSFVENINNSIIVERDNIVIDGAGYNLQGSGSGAGIELPGSNNVTIKNMTITKFWCGIYVSGGQYFNPCFSSFNNIFENRITENWYGILLDDSNNNIIFGNYIAANEVAAIRLGSSAHNNIVVANNITDNNIGISTIGYSNRFHHNNFVNNTSHAEVDAYAYHSNEWDNGYPSGGNYWSDYNGVDLYSGSNQNELGSDGIGDTPVIIDTYNRDKYPLMNPSVFEHTFVLTITATLGGTTIPESGIYIYDAITYVNVTAVAFTGYLFDYWILDNQPADISSPTCIPMDNNHTLEAIFVPVPIHIRTDGSIDPSDAPVSNIDNVTYTLTASTSHSIIVERDNIIFDGAGHVIQGTGPSYHSWHVQAGIDIQNRNNVTVENMTVKTFASCAGISLLGSNNSILRNNSITSNLMGIGITGSSNVLRNNVMNDNNYSFVVFGEELSQFINDVDASNIINGKPIIYMVNAQNLVIDPQTYPSVGFLAVVNSTNISIKNLNFMKNNYQSILFAYTNDSLIQNVNVAENEIGIFLFHSSNNTITHCNLKHNSIGLWACESSNNSVYRNNFINNTYRQAELSPWLWMSFYPSFGPKLSVNVWDNGYPSGGNYWSDYAGVDANGDGIGDTPYVVGVDESELLLSDRVYCSGILEREYNLTLTKGNKLHIYAAGFLGRTMDFKIVSNGTFLMERLNVSQVDEIWVAPANGTYTFHVNSTDNEVRIGVAKCVDITDKYPLAAPFCNFDVGTWNETSYSIDVVSNFTVSDFCFNVNPAQPFISFNITGENGTRGFCRVAIPKDLLWTETNWTVYVDGQPVNYTLIFDEDYTYISFTYNHSTKTVQIIGTHVIPEYPSSHVLLIFIIATLLATTVYIRKRFMTLISKLTITLRRETSPQ